MSRFGRPHVTEMLHEQSLTLERIFGTGGYTVEKTGDYSANIKTKVADFCVSDDPRDFVAVSIVDIPGLHVIQSPIDTWMQFLGEDIPAQKRADSYEKQLSNELRWISIIVDRILKDRATTRDAVWFITGYNRAYNDWASRKGSWWEPDFDQ